jgi:pimeloyl-ACP methyl ester carboxylesterase
VQRAGIPVLAIWAGQDDVIPPNAMDRLTSWNGNAENHVIEGAGHGLTYTHTPQVLRLIEDFLERRG